MQDEEFDHMDELIREASNSHHPVYDDKAWEKMEQLLDEHLPRKKDRKRPFIFFLLLLFITGAAFFLYQLSYKKENISGDNRQAGSPIQKMPATMQTDNDSKPGGVVTREALPAGFLQSTKKHTQQDIKRSFSANHLTIKKVNIKMSGAGTGSDLIKKDDVVKTDTELGGNNQQAASDDNITIGVSALTDSVKDQQVNANIQTPKQDSTRAVVDKEATIKAAPAPVAGKPPAGPSAKKGFTNNFVLNISAGPDLSFVSGGNAGKTRLNYGAGLSYTFANRITLRSGFYIAKKTYSTKGAGYHPPGGYWTYNTDLEKVNADCNVYEIPLSASYNFKQSKNSNWFAGVGFSTFLMKRETYNYLYKDAWGQARNKEWTLLNGGNHYFSVMTISGGYQYRVNHYFSILAEPYFKLPLQGIGFGKIKLNSGGLLFTASLRPFAKRK